MIIKVCGMREAENIRQVAALGVDMMGFIFYRESKRFVSMIPSGAGIIPDYARSLMPDDKVAGEGNRPKRHVERVGVFVDDMPQNIITRIYNYSLDCVQLHGSESRVMIDNLKRSVDPDIKPGLKIIKALSIVGKEDIERWHEYQGSVDMLLFDTKGPGPGGNGRHFDWRLLDAYDGDIPFLLSGGIDLDDVDDIQKIRHPQFLGIDINSRFEKEPAVKDVEKIRRLVEALHR